MGLPKIIALFFCSVFLWSNSATCQSESDSTHMLYKAEVIKTLMKNLSYEEKVQMVEYNRFLGASIDKELMWSLAQLDSASQAKSLNYIMALQVKSGRTLRTSVSWSTDTLKMGHMEEGDVFKDSLKVTNNGTNPYFITDIKASCDCTVIKFSNEIILPGESAWLPVIFDSIDKAGPIAAAIVVQDNSTPNSRSILYLNGDVRPKKKVKAKKKG